jgi:pyridoxamine 5'-phosphate oxidase
MQESFFVKDTNYQASPFEMFNEWFNLAKNTKEIKDATAFALATAKDNRPAVRIVLLKNVENDGFTFFTNENSHKGQDLLSNPQAEMCFYWEPLGKQIRIYGKVLVLDSEKSDEYFASRSLESRFGACVSKQSSELASYETLQNEYKLYVQTHEKPIRPKNWHGFKIIPQEFEFWQDGKHRLHLRHKYSHNGTSWKHIFLYP